MEIEKSLKEPVESGLTFQQLPRPSFDIEQTRWATLRGENVSKIAEHWKKNPNLVKVISDPKLNDNELVLLSRSNFESLYKLVRDLESGQAGLSFDVDVLFNQLSLVDDLVRQQDVDKQTGTPILSQLKKAVEVAVQIVTRSKAKLVVFNQQEYSPVQPLSEEERRELDLDSEDL